MFRKRKLEDPTFVMERAFQAIANGSLGDAEKELSKLSNGKLLAMYVYATTVRDQIHEELRSRGGRDTILPQEEAK